MLTYLLTTTRIRIKHHEFSQSTVRSCSCLHLIIFQHHIQSRLFMVKFVKIILGVLGPIHIFKIITKYFLSWYFLEPTYCHKRNDDTPSMGKVMQARLTENTLTKFLKWSSLSLVSRMFSLYPPYNKSHALEVRLSIVPRVKNDHLDIQFCTLFPRPKSMWLL
jgi:hypothetical protein